LPPRIAELPAGGADVPAFALPQHDGEALRGEAFTELFYGGRVRRFKPGPRVLIKWYQIDFAGNTP
jgi:hypothetical protein